MLSDFAATLALAVLLGSVAAVLFRFMNGPEVQRVSRRVECPQLGRPADVVALRDVHTGGWVSVERCPLRPKAGPVRCHSECLRVLALKVRPSRRDARRGRG